MQNTYDELGQLTSKGVGGKTTQNRLQTVDYTYNIRGWLKQINNPTSLGVDLFGFKLNYNTVNYGATPLYNGNIAETVWRTANTDNSLKWYKYDYDALNRLTNAVDNLGKLNETLNYDKNGNINSLVRLGHIVGGTTIPDINNPLHFGTMDNLVYTYETNSNKLKQVLDNANKTYGFKDSDVNAQDYWYDTNGNMTKDGNKGITNITYNHLNLPMLVTITGGTISYIYDATGVKQRKIVSTGVTTDYAGNYVYENGNLQFFNTAEGYVEPNGSGFNYVYQYKDHLGNIRLSYKDISLTSTPSLQIVEENNYYPFGLKHKGYNNVQVGRDHKFGFGNKEEQDDNLGGNQLNWLDFGARNYDAALGRWMNVDPNAHLRVEWTPYNAMRCNPIMNIDPDGALDTDFKDKDGNTISHVEDGSNAVFQLKGTDQTNERFEFTGYNDQGGKNEVSLEGAITGAQDYVTNNYTKCNQSVNFVGRTYESAAKAQGKTVDNIGIVNGNSLARGITGDLTTKVTAETSVATAQASAAKGNLVVGANGGHVVTMTTKTFDVTRFNTSGSIIEKKQIGGQKTTNVNGSFRATNIGPGQLNSFQNPNYSGMTWYSLPATAPAK